ncbi:MAG TPA: phosphomannomutase, partial [Magnetospirillaceae bacterium]|nr:phosphomannomutase [Magnetospirillaceae bacterium]
MATIRESLSYKPVELQFGTSGLRGLVKDMTDLECYINTLGFLAFTSQTDALKPGSKVFVAADLRRSSVRMLRAVDKAIVDSGFRTVNCGLIPTPALASYAMSQKAPCVMVTGSHVPDDRNGIKFYKLGGEVLKEDELVIRQAVTQARATLYALPAEQFTPEGMLTQPRELPAEDPAARQHFMRRFVGVFGGTTLAGKKVVCYDHSSVGRDMLAQLLTDMGATVVSVGRSEAFVPVDSENVTPDDRAYFKVIAEQHPDVFAIVSSDGDSDRPFMIDETGMFHRGDVLGALVADWLDADAAA